MQKTGGDSLAGLSGSGHNFLSNKSASNIFSKATIILAVAFMINSLLIAKNITHQTKPKISITHSLGTNHNTEKHHIPSAPSAVE
jgi:preprotein translocase subunit SecG